MKRLRRWLFNLASGISLLLCVLVTVDRCTHPWCSNVYEYVMITAAGNPLEGHCYTISTGSGEIVLWHSVLPERRIKGSNLSSGFKAGSDPPTLNWKLGDTLLHRLGFGTFAWAPKDGVAHGVEAPSWFVALLLLILPTMWFKRHRPHIPPGHCKQCGYDLRATPERCPECGTPAVSTPDL